MLLESYTPVTSNQSIVPRPNTSSGSPAIMRRRINRSTVPAALPCFDFYTRYPAKVGPIGNVLITSEAEMQPWLLVAQPVSREEAKAHGGCIMFNVSLDGAETATARSLYYRIPGSDDEVYGRAAYLPRSDTHKGLVKPEKTLRHSSGSHRSFGSVTDSLSGETEASSCSVCSPLRSSDSCYCVFGNDPVLYH